MLILASLSGIQDFLFDIRESGGGQARSLRNRSFRIQLIAECVALRLLEAAKLPYAKLVFSAAGKVCIDAKGISTEAVRAVREAAADIERQLLGETHGRLRFAMAMEEPTGSFAQQFERANHALAVNKLRPFAVATAEGAWSSGSLVVPQVWDVQAEAEQDAEFGRRLVISRWLTIRDSNVASDHSATITLGFRVSLDANEPVAADGIVSCSNLADPGNAPRSLDRRVFHPRRIARQVPRDAHGQPIEFVDLADRARGAPMLGVLKADADSLGAAVSATLRRATGSNGAASLRTLSEALDRFFSETLEAEKTGPGSRWNSIYTVFSGGDDLLAVGPWDVMLDFAARVQTLFNWQFGPGATSSPSPTPLTISAAVAIIKPKYPIHLAAQQAEELLEQAKCEKAPRADKPKDQCAALGGLWKWSDHDAILHAGKQLADWVDAGIIERGWLHTLLQLALLRRGQAGPEYAGVHPAVATSRLAYHVARNWPKPRRREDAPPPARAWIDAILREFDQFDSTTHVTTMHLPAIVRYAMLATRSGGSED